MAGVLGAVAVIAVFGVVNNGIAPEDDKDTTASADVRETRAPQQDEPQEEEAPAPKTPIKVTAKKTAFTASILADGGNYTSVKVTVTNNSDETIDVNPLYFAITDSKGTKHSQELAADKNQLEAVDLAPGENISGVVTGKGKFTPTHVTYTQFLSDPVRVPVT
ncbi:DUF4352 domain-containing protein [Streptomyces albicerus]|uniref:DUF4352 domain-containing protein n=1 Tax=Streptomyces albicerus TaxID=2569859 RepID=UPI001CED5432|nr:DUF4352 domain-containing protein [Streptomyces albicerus]